MTDFIFQNEGKLRLGFFFGILIIMAIWEVLSPRRELNIDKSFRWMSNLSIVVLNTIVLRLLFPAAAVGMAAYAAKNNYGLFNLIDMPSAFELVFCVIFMDMLIYWQHVIFHRVPILWRIHRMHHADQDIDVTTGSRFHPVEIILSMLIKFAAVLILGIPIVAIILFEIILNLTAMFNHSNVNLPQSLDKLIRKIIVTPDMHRVHHSVIPKETNSNYGFNLSLWDKLFGTYIEQPEMGHLEMTIGLYEYRDEKISQALDEMLLIPFKK